MPNAFASYWNLSKMVEPMTVTLRILQCKLNRSRALQNHPLLRNPSAFGVLGEFWLSHEGVEETSVRSVTIFYLSCWFP